MQGFVSVRTEVRQMIGQTFGRLTVVSEAGKDERGNRLYRCVCQCKIEIVAAGFSLRYGYKKSCGCLRRDLARAKGVARGIKVASIPLTERFWSGVDKNGPMPTGCSAAFGNCWVWTGGKTADGRGVIVIEKTNKYATHVSWFLENGVWSARRLLHVCDTSACIRPRHLFEGTKLSDYDRGVKAKDEMLITAQPVST